MLHLIIAALRRITNPHFYRDELGYQAELYAELRAVIHNAGLPANAIIQQDPQKRLRDHGINVRPDLIVHVPTTDGGDVRQNNFAAFELNHQAGPAEVAADFANLDTITQALNYPLAIFINIGTRQTQANHYRGQFRDRLHCFAVRALADREGIEIHHSFFRGNDVVTEAETVPPPQAPQNRDG